MIELLKQRKTTYKQLAQRFEVSTKTIERDIDRLSAMGIPVYCTQGVGGGVCLDEHFKFNTSFFTHGDIHEIIFALKIMNSFSEKPQKNDIISKLCLIAPELSTMFEQDADHYFSVDLLSEKMVVDNKLLEQTDYCLEHEVFAILNSSLQVAPIGYVLKPDGLSLFCFSDCYQVIGFRDIRTIEPTRLCFERAFISYEEFKKNSR